MMLSLDMHISHYHIVNTYLFFLSVGKTQFIRHMSIRHLTNFVDWFGTWLVSGSKRFSASIGTFAGDMNIIMQTLVERLRSLVGLNGWDYCIYWKLSEDERLYTILSDSSSSSFLFFFLCSIVMLAQVSGVVGLLLWWH